MTRQNDSISFITKAGWQDATVVPLAGDASNRRYDRLTKPDGTCAVLMDAPPEKGEDVRPFVKIAEFLCSIGLSAPQVLAQDSHAGFLLIEDLGDDLYARKVIADPPLELPLYKAAVDVLGVLHRSAPPPLPRYEAAITVPLAALAFDWYQFGAAGKVDEAAKTKFQTAFAQAISPLDTQLDVLIQRDYHAENLLWLPQRDGVARVGLLDFQDAMLGHRSYDLVSILQDARRDVSPDVQTAMIDRFIDQNCLDRDEFTSAYAVFGVQRNLRILGVFARLCLRDRKAHYVDLIPRVWRLLQTNLAHPAMSEVAQILNSSLPEPDSVSLKTLRSKCGTCPDR